MPEPKLDRIIKDATPLSRNPTPSFSVSEYGDPERLPVQTNPLMMLPSSPPLIYLNLLILEASLRAQYLTLRARRRQHTFFLFLLSSWITYFVYALFLRPREDGRGVGGSVYWMVETAEKMALMGGLVTAILVWGTGQWERGIRWPRRWLATANRGLRNINTKLVVIQGPWWQEALSALAILFPSPSLFPLARPSYRGLDPPLVPSTEGPRPGPGYRGPVDGVQEESLLSEDDFSNGGDVVKLLLSPKPFSPDFRENWELYRTEYWEKENERRAARRRQVRSQQRELAKQQGGWLWWTSWRGWKRCRHQGSKSDTERNMQASLHSHHHHHHHTHLSRHYSEKEMKHRRMDSSRSGSYSGNSSRSTTPTRELDDSLAREHVRRRGSNSSSVGGRPRKNRQSSSTSSNRPKRIILDSRPSGGTLADSRPLSSRANASAIESD